MHYIANRFYIMLFMAIGLIACNKEEDPEAIELEVEMAEDIPADPNRSGDYTYFDMETGQMLTKADSNSTQWDIAFAGTTILTNGGTSGPGAGSAQIVDGIFENIESAPADGYAVDSESSPAIPTGSGNGWYTYTGSDGTPTNAILPIPGKVIILTTGEGHYAKMEILSYYEGNPDTSTAEFADFSTRPAGRYYTLRYVVQTNGTANF